MKNKPLYKLHSGFSNLDGQWATQTIYHEGVNLQFHFSCQPVAVMLVHIDCTTSEAWEQVADAGHAAQFKSVNWNSAPGLDMTTTTR